MAGGNGNNFGGYTPRPPGSGRKSNLYGFNSRRRAAPWLLKSQFNHPPKRNLVLKLLPLYFLAAAVITGFLVSSGLVATPLVAGLGTYQYYYNRVQIGREYSLSFETTRIYDRNGKVLFEKLPVEGVREYVKLKDIPKTLIDATLSTEDPSFFDNQGVDPTAVMRALYINISGQGSSGASTITQQVARLLFMSPEERSAQSFDRKINEVFLAIKLTEKYTKEEILEKYLNTIYYGNLAYGIEAASKGYFGKDARDLTLPEASMLAGLPQLPSDYDPTVDDEHYSLAKRRQKRVLELMVQNGKITSSDALDAYSYDIKGNLHDQRRRDSQMLAPHFVNYVLAQLGDPTGNKQLSQGGESLIPPDEWNRGGYDIYTTLDYDMFSKAQEVVSTSVEELKKLRATNSALVAMRPGTGEVLAMVGSVDFNNVQIGGQVNTAVALRQPGSALKPITYATAIEKGWSAATVLSDIKQKFPSGGREPYIPLNFDLKEHGPVSVRDALGSSLNIPAVLALQYDGVQTMMDKAKDMGITFQYPAEHYGLTLTLGGGEVRLLDLTNAYTVFDNLGKKVDPVVFLKISKHDKAIYQFEPKKLEPKQVLKESTAYIITNILSDNKARLLAFAPDNPLVLDRPAAAKTGTTNDFHDSWTVGYTPDLVAGVWVGNNNNAPMDGVAGAIGGGKVWHNFMTEVYKDPNLLKVLQVDNKPLRLDFERPSSVVDVTICTDSGLLPSPNCPKTRTELFDKDKVPTQKDNSYLQYRLSRDANGPCIAGPDYPESAVEYRNYRVYPTELAGWSGKSAASPPSQPCQTYIPPSPTPTAVPSPTTTLDPGTAWPGVTVLAPAQETTPPAVEPATTPPARPPTAVPPPVAVAPTPTVAQAAPTGPAPVAPKPTTGAPIPVAPTATPKPLRTLPPTPTSAPKSA